MSLDVISDGRMTAEEYFAMPEGPPYYQLIDGELYMSPSPRRRHQRLLVGITSALYEFAEQRNLGHVYVAPSNVLFTRNNVFQPDIYYVSTERLDILTEQGAEGAPDLVVEILSPGTTRLDLGRKREIYSQEGVTELWIVSPRERILQVYRLGENATIPARTFRADEVLTTELLPGFALKLSKVFDAVV